MSPNEFKTRLAELEKQISDLKSEYYGNTSSTLRGGGGYVSISLICNSTEITNLYNSGYLDNFVGVANYDGSWDNAWKYFHFLLVQKNYLNKAESYANSSDSYFGLVSIPDRDNYYRKNVKLKDDAESNAGHDYSRQYKMFRPVFNIL